MKREKHLLSGVQYCARCCMPETQEGITFDEMGICQACQSSEQKIHIDWIQREKQLQRIFSKAKRSAGNNYDCIVPISGGKDSTFQLHVLVKVYGMKPLAVTFSHNWFSEIGWYNLQNSLDRFNVDHIMFTPNRGLINRIAKRSLEGIGDTCWHCHAGVGAFPLHIAVKYRIPLLVWGESIAESSGRASYKSPVRHFDREYFTKVSAKLKPSEMVCDYLSERDLYPFHVPSVKEIADAGVFGIHLGDYIFWDDERQTEFVRDTYDWKETEIEGAFKQYKSAECAMAGMHDFTCYLKRGYGRGTFQACTDVRNGLLTREEGFSLARKHDPVQPHALDYYLRATGMTKQEFYKTMKEKQVKKIAGRKILVRQHKSKKTVEPYVETLLKKYRG